MKKDMLASVQQHWPFAILAFVAAILIFTNLGRDYLWADEGDTAVLASNITKFGLPRAWDGHTFMDSDFGARENDRLVMVSSPWLQYYIAAASFLVFGENTLAARLPFALAAWATILLVYQLVWRATASRSGAFCASLILVSSVQFLLYARQSRYYGLSMLLSCWLIWIFGRMESKRECALFGTASILLFHTHPIGLVLVGALGFLTLVSPLMASRRQYFWSIFPVVLIFTVPWFFLARSGYSENVSFARSGFDFGARFGQYMIECASVTPLAGVGLLAIFVAARGGVAPRFEPRERDFMFLLAAAFFVYAIAMAASQRTAAMWVTGVRYTAAVIPFVAAAAGCLIAKVSRGRIFLWLPLVVAFSFTNFAQVGPWLVWADKSPDPEGKIVAAHVPNKTIDRFIPTAQFLFVRDLWCPNVGTIGKSCEFLLANARSDEVLITNYEAEPLYFYTHLAQAMKIMRQDTIYDAARRQNLPDYVFSVDHVRWIVWRFNWNDYLGIRWSDVLRDLSEYGALATDVAEIKETAWENRENIHFHRFSGDTYLFPQDANRLPAHIFRIDWPNNS